MKQVCFCDETYDIVVEAEICADPIWCGTCNANLDLDEFPVPEGLKAELHQWNQAFDRHLVSQEYEGIMPSFSAWLNAEGEKLTHKLNQSLPETYTVRYRPYPNDNNQSSF